MDCLQQFGQFKQVLNCNGLKQKCLSKIRQFRGYYIKNPHIAHLDEILELQKQTSAINEAY